ncbi:hypothetical protein HBI56_183150 [Parastagonospora nodorum]|uniref:Uncharacterized protein n=1 Tax=Phaeosphaeria nodorum (strain SN15 / ATCC MYA-4574 / FGSC 10173) TaxID=321614 RepID=A0A7U2I7N5_PHANO|nr:hypothetical protein HBH56_191630 [Parastagonospora nodorum]QRD03097.1 hypothetical protein JI435_419130 [Parastagonospora nodorum SN15]KAH3937870.1 hypothetical protein HBH54_010370 [Parastagonospora nodorum]KAH3940706.1 hypothetical protein HBH53_211970 [Parastagonospora nodorum]KAH3977807.1 hypothetical protein HBH51_072150 [Parastagonospora nodorum]
MMVMSRQGKLGSWFGVGWYMSRANLWRAVSEGNWRETVVHMPCCLSLYGRSASRDWVPTFVFTHHSKHSTQAAQHLKMAVHFESNNARPGRLYIN